jgi:cardiolipin synthase
MLEYAPELLVLWAVLEVAGIAVAADAVATGRASEGAIAWAISLVFFPLAAIPLYLLFGNRRFHGYVKARRSNVPAIREATTTLLQELDRRGLTATADAEASIG